MADESAQTPEGEPKKKTNLLVKLLALGFMILVIASECMLASMYLSSANEALANAKTTHVEGVVEKAASAQGEDDKDDSRAEIDLSDFSVTVYQPATNSTMFFNFKLFGVVGVKDQPEFAAMLASNKHRFRSTVLTTIRSADVKELTDPGLGLIRRKILTTVNRSFGKDLLKDVLFTDFSFFEQ